MHGTDCDEIRVRWVYIVWVVVCAAVCRLWYGIVSAGVHCFRWYISMMWMNCHRSRVDTLPASVTRQWLWG